ncbi:PREDICTED: uncharacterized protein LOC108508044 isoform X2 [Lepidothrix coronata]|nr:PREDICTED: uncharacterized protein LOC108508044 isoform X2 [Lepidothrix coronata]
MSRAQEGCGVQSLHPPLKGRMRPPRGSPALTASVWPWDGAGAACPEQRPRLEKGQETGAGAAPTAIPAPDTAPRSQLCCCSKVISPGSSRCSWRNGEGRCPPDTGELRLLFPAVGEEQGWSLRVSRVRCSGQGGRRSECSAWEARDPSVSLKRKHGKRLSWESSSGGKGIAGSSTQRLCVRCRGRAAACVNCCGCAERSGALLPTQLGDGPWREGSARGADSPSTCITYLLSQSFLLGFLPTLDLCRCRALLQVVPKLTNLGCLCGAPALTQHVWWEKGMSMMGQPGPGLQVLPGKLMERYLPRKGDGCNPSLRFIKNCLQTSHETEASGTLVRNADPFYE